MPRNENKAVLGTPRVADAAVPVAASAGTPAAESGDGIASADRQGYMQQQHDQESTTACVNVSRVLLHPSTAAGADAATKEASHTLPPRRVDSQPEQGISLATPAALGRSILSDNHNVVVKQQQLQQQQCPTPNQPRPTATHPDFHGGDVGNNSRKTCSKPLRVPPQQQPSSIQEPEIISQGRQEEETGAQAAAAAAAGDVDTLAPSHYAKGQAQAELGIRGGRDGDGDGDGGSGSGSGERPARGNDEGVVCLTEERVAAVQCYLRDGDPIFIRSNLKRLKAGTLVRLRVDDTVVVARR